MPTAKKRILVTGASGQIGYMTFKKRSERTDRLEVFGVDRKQGPSVRVPGSWELELPEDRFSVCDLSDFDSVRKAVESMDVVVHLGADPEGNEWDSVLNNNVIGTYNVFEASRQAGVKRVVAASSIMVSEGHRD
jgi:nucleoside-diphosphate-sugar epimerase